MKQKKLKFITVVLLLMFIGAGCQKDKIELADENIVIQIGGADPGWNIYKTKGDYFNYISFQLLDDGRLNATPDLTLSDIDRPIEKSRLKRDKNGVIVPNFRWHLTGGYILDQGIGFKDRVFTNISFNEFVNHTDSNNVSYWTDELLRSRIIDKDPFEKFYYLSRYGRSPIILTVGEINKMIKEGTLEEVFKKAK